jgi:hypothetical protein
MKSLVVYESFYGNTEAVARAIADGLARHGDARAVTVGSVDAAALDDVDLLVVGAPTHAWGLPRAKTRPQSLTNSCDSMPPLVREWLSGLPTGGGRPAGGRVRHAFAWSSVSDRFRSAGHQSTASTAGLEDGRVSTVVRRYGTERSTGLG